jgi:hypothetical protein
MSWAVGAAESVVSTDRRRFQPYGGSVPVGRLFLSLVTGVGTKAV